jgi:putative ABC transport system permease protein
VIAVKNLLAEKTRLVMSVLGVAFGVLLMLVMTGLFVGTTRQVTTYIDHSRNAVWVMQPGVSQMFKAVSWLPADTRDQLLALPEVESADPILGLPSDFVHNGTHTAYFVVGYDPATGVGGPWSLSQGRTVEQPGEAVLDRILAGKNGIGLGDRVQIIDEDFTVVGLSNQTAAATNYYTFVSLADAARLLRAGSRVSYFLAQPKPGLGQPGLGPEELAAGIERSLPGVDALTSTAFAENSRDIIVKMIGRPLKTMIALATLVGIALVGLTVWALTAEQMADFGVLRALGVGPNQLWRSVLGQAGIIAALGYLIGASATYGAQVVLGDRMGDVTIAITPTMLAVVAAGTAAMAALGCLLPGRRISRIDPAIAFRH